MENSSSETPAPNPRNYENEVRTFRQESTLTREMQEDYKREALRKCNDLHAKLLDCYEKKYFCGTAEKEFWDCYRRERGFRKSKVSGWVYKLYHGATAHDDFSQEQQKKEQS